MVDFYGFTKGRSIEYFFWLYSMAVYIDGRNIIESLVPFYVYVRRGW